MIYIARLCDHTPNALNTKSVLRKEIRLKMAHESCKSQTAVLEMNGQSVPQRWTSMREGSNTARRQCSAWNWTLKGYVEDISSIWTHVSCWFLLSATYERDSSEVFLAKCVCLIVLLLFRFDYIVL